MSLMLHAGARQVERTELASVATPPSTATWFPVPHVAVVDRVEETLAQSGFKIAAAQYGLSRSDARMFAVLKLDAILATGVSLAVGIRNSLDKSFPISFCSGSSVFVCDNLSFQSELLVTRKHTKNGATRFAEAIALAVQSLTQFHANEALRIQHYQQKVLTEEKASHLIVQAFEGGIVSARQLPDVLREWHEPSYEEFRDRSLWSLLNAFTTAMGDRVKTNPQQYAHTTIQLNSLLDQAIDMAPASEAQHVVSA